MNTHFFEPKIYLPSIIGLPRTKHNFQCFKAECFVQRAKFERKTTILNLKRIMNAKTIRTMK